ncbi:MAG: hypothetical protein F6J96_34610 [Symploca sp. SIO1C2]|nr:hypothetical protein [Symploca sp. SIO1C2]
MEVLTLYWGQIMTTSQSSSMTSKNNISANSQDTPDNSLIEEKPTLVVNHEIAKYFEHDDDLRRAIVEWQYLWGLSSI